MNTNIQSTLPYPGLRPFEETDHRLFFGRDCEVSQMLQLLEERKFLAVVGSSGSGKSSLVKAGLLPAIREGFLSETTEWLSIVVKPGHDPFRRLARALIRSCAGPAASPFSVPSVASTAPTGDDNLEKILRRSDRGLINAFAELRPGWTPKVLLVVDQFEELFAFRRTSSKNEKVASRDEAGAFVSMLLHSCGEIPISRNTEGDLRVAITMRSDFIGHCEAFLRLPESVSRSQFLVPRMDGKQMEEAIRCPGEVEDAGFDKFSIEDNLVNRIINETGDRPDHLPLMQHALMQSWKNAKKRSKANGSPVTIEIADYEDAGGVDRALDKHADAAWNSIKADPKQAAIAQRLFLLLCDVTSEGQIARRRPKVTEVLAVTQAPLNEIDSVVRLFQDDDRNFILPLREEPLTPDVYLDISHESLFRNWKTLKEKWLRMEAESVEEYRGLLSGARRHQRNPSFWLNDIQLGYALEWRKREQPTSAWAARHGGDLESALRFLDHSTQHNEAEKAKREQEQERLLNAEKEARAAAEERERVVVESAIATAALARARNMRNWVIGVSVFAFMAISLIYLIRSRAEAKEKARQAAEQVEQAAEQAQRAAKQAEIAAAKARARSENERKAAEDKWNSTRRISRSTALAYIVRALHIDKENPDAKADLCKWLSLYNWSIPRSPILSYDANIPVIVAASGLLDGDTVVAIGQDGTLLRWPKPPGSASANSPQGATQGTSFSPFPPADTAVPLAGRVSNSPSSLNKNHAERSEGKPLASQNAALPKINSAAFSEDGNYLITIAPAPLASAQAHVPAQAHTPSSTTLAPGHAQFWVRNESSGQFARVGESIPLKGTGAVFRTIGWAKDGHWLSVATYQMDKPNEGFFELLKYDENEKKYNFETCFAERKILGAWFSANGKRMMTASPNADSTTECLVEFWDVDSKGIAQSNLPPVPLSMPKPYSVALDADEKWLVASAWGTGAMAVDLTSPALSAKALAFEDGSQVTRVLFPPAGVNQHLLAVSTNNRVEMVDLDKLGDPEKDSDGSEKYLMRPSMEPIPYQGTCIPQFSRDGQRLLTLSGSTFLALDAVRVWDVQARRDPTVDEKTLSIPDGEAPKWLIDLASTLSDTARRVDDGDEPRESIAEIYRDPNNRKLDKPGVYDAIWKRYSPPEKPPER